MKMRGNTFPKHNKEITKEYAAIIEKNIAAEPATKYLNTAQLEKLLLEIQDAMKKAAKEMDFMEAARLRDQMLEISRKMEPNKK